MKTKEIKLANPQGTMTKLSGTYSIQFTNGVLFQCTTPKEQLKLWEKLKNMGYFQSYNFQSDEEDGLSQANELNLPQPKASCLCSNPLLNF